MGMDFISLMRKLAPDLAEEMTRRALILDRIGATQPVGRRQLASRLNLSEREVRNTAQRLREMGYVEVSPSGITLTTEAVPLMEAVSAFSKALSGLTEMEKQLSVLLKVETVVIVPGDADQDTGILTELGRIGAGKLRGMLKNGDTLAVTGGRTLASIARGLQGQAPMNVMVVPARGGMGREVAFQANTLASEIATRLGGHYRLLHLPDSLDPTAKAEMLKQPEVSETMDLLQRADVILHGVSRADDRMAERKLPRKVIQALRDQGACGECFGSFFNMQGECLLVSSSVSVDLGKLSPSCRMIAAAAGASKAEAIISVLRHDRHRMLLSDEGAARRMIALLS